MRKMGVGTMVDLLVESYIDGDEADHPSREDIARRCGVSIDRAVEIQAYAWSLADLHRDCGGS